MKKKIFNIDEIKYLYLIKKYSISSIAKKMNTTPITITKFMREREIPINSKRKSQNSIIELSDEQTEILNGCLLGDGHLTKSNINSSFNYLSSIRNHTKLIYTQFSGFGGSVKRKETYDKRTLNIYISYRYLTKTNETFTKLRNIWYPSGIKIIPKNLKLTKLTCLYWYIGDGSLSQNYKKKETSYLKLSTNNFTCADIDNILLPQLNEFKAYRWENLIFIPRRNINDFLNYIGDCPFPEYEHKWNVFNYKNINLEKNGVKSHKHLKDSIIIMYNSNVKPYLIAKQLGIDSSLVKYYLKKYDSFKPNTENNLLKEWILTDPNGKVHKTNNISAFSREHKLSHKCLRDLAHGRSKYYKNWSCELKK